MAGRRQARKRRRTKPARSSSSKSRAGGSRRRPKGSGEYMREAVSEWRKAARFAMAALAPAERIKKAKSANGGVGDAADALLAKLGSPGKLASKARVGGRIMKRLRPGSGGGSAAPHAEGAQLRGNGNGRPPELGVPIQESIEIAVPLHAAYPLA